MVEKTAHNPAIRYAIDSRGFIREGYFADLVLVDTNQPWTANFENTLYHCRWTPFVNHQFSSSIASTWVNGQQVFDGSRVGGILTKLKEKAIEVNKKYSEMLGINQSTAITCVKPSGTVSQLVDSASGIHARHSAYYIRTVRGDNKDPLTQFMIDSGIPNEPDVMKPDSTTVFSFPRNHLKVQQQEMKCQL